MTNIGAIQFKKKSEEKDSEEYIVFVADGMGSNPFQHAKGDSIQKLFHVGEYLITGTGTLSVLQNTVMELSKRQHATAEDVAKGILEITDTFKLTSKDSENFIVGGKDKEGLGLYWVNTTGNFSNIDGTEDYSKRKFIKRTDAFDGSGSRFVNNYLFGMSQAGKPIVLEDVADGLALVYEFGKQGAIDAGVNDKLQYGIITQDGVTTIFHPEIQLMVSNDSNQFKNYLQNATGILVPKRSKELPPEEKKRILTLRSDLAAVLRNAYVALDIDLRQHSEARRDYTETAEEYSRDNISLDTLTDAKTVKAETKERVVQATQAFMSRDVAKIIVYKRAFDDRQRTIEDRSLSYRESLLRL